MNALANKNVLLGVTGGIAAYKAADLTRKLGDAGAEVKVVMTRAATAFVTPLTFQALSGNPVHTSLLDPAAEAAMGHIELARWADVILVAPATADFMAGLAHGRADELLTTLCLASEAPVVLAPAMNRIMWSNPATQANKALLESRDVRLLGPGSGDQACGEVGEGRMLEPLEIVALLSGLFATGELGGRQVVITAGPTREALDPVRYISNHSSGRMGFAVAQAASEAGAHVTLVSGPTRMPELPGIKRVDVISAQDMHDAVMEHMDGCDIFIGCAAVADYRPAVEGAHKIKKSAAEMSLSLVRNPDILAAVAALADGPFTVGFAAETNDLLEYAENKRRKKCIDMIAANLVGSGMGFNAADNALEVLWEGGHRSLPLATKEKLARDLVALISERYGEYQTNNVVALNDTQSRSQDTR